MTLADRWRNQLADLDNAGRLRRLTPPRGIDFASNDYLGYCGGRQTLPPAPSLPISGASSRLLRNHPIWEEVESALARWHGAEAALMFTSGYAANEGVLSTVISPPDWVASDQYNHASIIDGLRLAKAERFIFRHQDLNHLEDGLRVAAANRAPDRQLFIVTESIFGMDGDRTPLHEMADLAHRHGAHVVVDEAHATGCFGAEGVGLLPAPLRLQALATVHTGGKALGVAGAYVCGTQLLKDLLVNRCRHLIFSTALPPAVGAWWLEAIARVRRDDEGRRLLHENARLFRELLRRRGIAANGNDYIAPILLGEDAAATRQAARLQQQGFDIRAIRPPSVPTGTARLRIPIHADHGAATLAALADALASN